MDKTEYQIKLDEINRLVDLQEYEDALEIVDSIEWKRVKSVRTLCMVAEIYEINGELEDSMRILQLAYKRSSLGKTILYRQVELALKMKKYDDAVKYYNKYLEAAANDNSKYILKYKIYKAQKAPLEDLIVILEEYKEREYTERWVYELARLYKMAGNQQKCIETCDDLILWFGEGKYVMKAMELKMTYVPLSASQKVKYEQQKKSEEMEVRKSAEMVKPAAKTVQPKVKPTQESMMTLSVKTSSMQPVDRTSESVKSETAPVSTKYPSFLAREGAWTIPTAEEPMKEAAVTLESLKEAEKEVETASLEQEPSIESILASAAAEIMAEKEAESVGEAFENQQETAVREETKTEVSNHQISTEELQKNLAKSLEQVFSGLHRTKMVDSFEALGRSTGSEIPSEVFEENIEEYQLTDLDSGDLREENISTEEKTTEEKIIEEAKETTIEEETIEETVIEEEIIEKKPEEEKFTKVLTETEELDLEALFAETSSDFAKMVEDFSAEEESEAVKENIETEEESEAVKEDIETEEESEAVKEDIETKEESETVEETIATDEMEADAAVSAFEESLLAGLQDIPGLEDYFSDDDSVVLEEVVLEEPADTDIMQEDIVQEEKENPVQEPEMDLVERLMMEADSEPSTYQSLADETPQDKRHRILSEESQTTLSEDQKALFSYFCKVPGMNNQILDAINGVYRYADEKTSRRGNIAIMGSHGTGKTRLGEGLVKAICKRFGIEAAKYARIDALELNRKDIAAVVGKMAGGFLMVERANLLTPATIKELSKAMDFRTDSMVLIIEDEKDQMRQLLSEYPEFAEKFETVISIPVFTNDELVTFARTYARENGFKMDELGVLALYALIGDNQREDEPITIGRVKSMVDAAIRHATNARLGRRLSKRHVDEDGRILLYEKDFED